ncbi:MAG: FeS-binding protein [Desulfuromonas sp.]|nr:MAG: FeS-binding protein [Desulfuromonas sp.]
MKQKMIDFIVDRVEFDPDNRIFDDEPYFTRPLVAIADAADPLFSQYKTIIGKFHRHPFDWLADLRPDNPPRSGSVICWVLPISEAVRKSNRAESTWPSRSWALTRQHGEAFNVGLRQKVVAFLQERGGLAVAPQLAPGWQEVASPQSGAASAWSERHAAYAAGLGTFSLNDGLITRCGIAHRLGSVVTDLKMEADVRPWPNHLHNCVYHRNGSCGVCIKRCPVKAISKDGHDKIRCMEYVYGTVVRCKGEEYGVHMTGCGLCQTGVPCEKGIPPG